MTELQNWIQQSEELLRQKIELSERVEVCRKIESEIVPKRDELKGIELLIEECAEESTNESGEHYRSSSHIRTWYTVFYFGHPLFSYSRVTEKDSLPVEEKKVNLLKEHFCRFELQFESYQREIELLQEKMRKSEISAIQRTLEDYDRWMQSGPHYYQELQVGCFSLLRSLKSFETQSLTRTLY